MRNSIAIFTFSIFILGRKYSFWANLLQKMKIVISNWSFVFRLIWVCRLQWWYWVFFFRPERPLLGKFGIKNEICWLKLKFCIQTNLKMLNSIGMLTLFALDQKNPFWAILLQTMKIVRWSWNFVVTLI